MQVDYANWDAPRDVKLGCAVMIHASTTGGTFSFTIYEEDCEFMDDLCKEVGWKPTSWANQKNTLSAVARELESWGYLHSSMHKRNEETMEMNEPTRWKVYQIQHKYRFRLNPELFPHYTPARPPESELNYILDRVFRYEGFIPLVVESKPTP